MLLDTPTSSVTPAAAETGPLVEEDAAPEVAPTSVDEPLPTELQPVVIETPPEVPTAPPLFESALPIDPGPLPEGLPNLSAQGCNSCHFEVHQQCWKWILLSSHPMSQMESRTSHKRLTQCSRQLSQSVQPAAACASPLSMWVV